jgi:tetratricopeptide (TPR) repeat protein
MKWAFLIVIIVAIVSYYFFKGSKKSAYVHSALNFYNEGKFDDAYREFSKELEIHPNSPTVLSNRGQIALQLGNVKQALSDFDRSIQLDKTYPQTFYNRGNLHMKTQSLELADSDFSRAIELDPSLYQAYVNRGSVLMLREIPERAIEDFTFVIENRERVDSDILLDALYNRANIYWQQRRFKDAINDFTVCLEISPTMHYVLNNRSNCYMNLKDFPSALKDIEDAILIGKELHVLYSTRGTIKSKMDQSQAAIADFDKSISIHPSSSAYMYRGMEYAKLGNTAQSEKDINESIRLAPNNYESYFNRGTLYFEMGNKNVDYYQKAIDDFTTAIEYSPAFSKAYEMRAKVYTKVGMKTKAEQDEKLAKKLDTL